jgi:NAD+ synthase
MDPEDLTIEPKVARRVLTEFLRTEIRRHGFERAIVGVSGGLDSAVTCYLAAEALHPSNVLAVRMPYRTSSPDSLDHAQLVVDSTGVRSVTVSITDMVEALFAQTGTDDNVRRGNAMARARMIVLYDQSSEFGGLVIGTSNKSEILLGYTTQYGDSACALNPLGDLYKTQVRQLGRALAVPQAILDKPPTADLWAGQTDEGELGFTYAEVDRLLHRLVDLRYTSEECLAGGSRPEFVRAVSERIRKNHFKRIPPPVAKVSARTVGYDFLYLRDWGT